MIRRIFENVSPKGKAMLAVAILFFTIYGLAGAGIMLVVLDMLQKVLEGQQVHLLSYWLALVGLVALKAACNVVADVAKHFAGFEVEERIRRDLLFRLKRFSLGYYTNERLGEISTIIHKDVTATESVVAHMWSRMASDVAVALILGTGLFLVDWRLGLAMVSMLPVALLVLFVRIRSGKAMQKRTNDDLVDMVSLFVEYVKGIPLLKAFNQSTRFQERLGRSIERFGASSKKESRSVAWTLGLYTLFLEMCFAVMAAVGVYLVLGNELTIFEYLMFIIISAEFYKPFAGMEWHWMNYIKLTDSYRRILTVLDAPVVETPGEPEAMSNRDIAFDGVGFSYERGGFEMRDISFDLKQGTLTALVGPSGSGKTTITSLLLRFWEPQRGTIRVGGTDIRSIDYDDLLGDISIVMQNVILFNDTISNNIKVGKPDATMEEVIAAAKKAMIHDFIEGLPQGYETLVRENGTGLSGGEKQRISIARAILKDAPIVVLDEMSSNVDPVNEAKIQRAISALVADRTVLVIAHHLRTIRTADKIIVLDRGRIVQEGTHDQLMEEEGLYRTLWQSQDQAKRWRLRTGEKGNGCERTAEGSDKEAPDNGRAAPSDPL